MSENLAMRHLLSLAGKQAITQLMKRRVLLAFDFDGTLAPIVAVPGDAQTQPEIAAALSSLALHVPVAVVTGRSVADVRARLGFEPHFVVGNHGAEGTEWSPSDSALHVLRDLVGRHEFALRSAGVQTEDKGLSIALHLRHAPDQSVAEQAVSALTVELPQALTFFGGKSVVNLALRDAPDKGDAVEWLLERSHCDVVLFVGDDVNDEAVFERAANDWLTVRIGEASDTSSAMYFVESHAGFLQFLEMLLRLVRS